MMQRQHGVDRFDTARTTEQVTRHGLGRTHHHAPGMLAESSFDGLGFIDVTQRGGGAVCVEVLNLINIDFGVGQCTQHSAARAVHAGRSHVAGVSTHAETGKLAINPGTTRFGVFVFFEHHHAGALAQHKAVAVFVPGTAGGLRVVVAGGQRAHGSKAAYTQR